MKDILVLQGDLDPSRYSPVRVRFTDENGKVSFCSGSHSLAQSALILLLTPKGSNKHDPNLGTSFLPLSGSWFSKASEVISRAALAKTDLLDQLGDRGLKNIEIHGVESAKDRLILRISIESTFGNSSGEISLSTTGPNL